VNLTRKNVLCNFSDQCRKSFNALKQAFISTPVLTHWIPDAQITVETDASDYAIAAILSNTTSDGELHPVAFHSHTLAPSELNYDTHDKELLAIFSAFKSWRHYLEGSILPVDVVTDHRNLEYFSTTKLLTRRQARWSEYLSQFNFMIRFRPGKLGTKPDALTRRWDVYPKGGNSDYAQVNPHNFRPVFTQEQLASSVRAGNLMDTILRAATIVDVNKLHEDIKATLPKDPVTSEKLASFSETSENPDPGWSLDSSGLLRLNDRIYVPDADDLRLRILKYKHDHILSGHFGQNTTLKLIRREYVWPQITIVCRKLLQIMH
jgi:hypothetical protein